MLRPFAVIGFTFAFVLALLYATSEQMAYILLIAGATGFIVSMILSYGKKVNVFPFAFATVILSCTVFLNSMYVNYYPVLELVGDDREICAEISDFPMRKDGRYYYELNLITVDGDKTDAKLLLSSELLTDAEVYDTVSFSATVYVLGGDKDEIRDYYRSKGVIIGAYTDSGVSVSAAESKTLAYHVAMLRNRIKNNLMSLMPNDRGGLTVALLLGDTSELTEETDNNFSDVGLSHLFSVSGLHISIWTLSVFDLLKRLGFRRKLSAGITMVFVLLFVALTGFSHACVRAGIMVFVMLAGELFDRPPDSFNSLGLALLLITLISPFSASSLSLQLSVMSVLGIIMLNQIMVEPFCGLIDKIKFRFPKRIAKSAVEIVAVTLSSMCFTLPLTIYSFGKIILISPLSNLLLLNLSAIVMVLGGITAIISGIGFLSFVSLPLASAVSFLSGCVLKCLRWLAGLSSFYLSADNSSVHLCIAGVLIIIALALLIGRRHKLPRAVMPILCTLVFICGLLSNSLINLGNTKISVLDVGNGSAVLVEKGKKSILLGCGGEYFAGRTIIKAIQQGRNAPELLLVPRIEETESSAVMDVACGVDVKRFILPEVSNELSFLSGFGNITETGSADISVWDGMRCQYLNNGRVCCAHLDLDGTTVLITFTPKCDARSIPFEWLGADILICRYAPPENLVYGGFNLVVVSAEAFDRHEYENTCVLTGGEGNIVINSAGNSVFNVSRNK